MNTPIDKPIDDEILMAYADGELDATQAAQIEQAMQTDAGIAARVAQHRALRAQLQGSFAAVLSEPVPQRLLNSLQVPAAGKVIDLAQARQNKTTASTRRWSSREWSAMAHRWSPALSGWYALSFNAGDMIGERGGALIAQGKLDSA
jgi:anti-sigma factor RsiW